MEHSLRRCCHRLDDYHDRMVTNTPLPDDRVNPPFIAGERAMLESWLEFHRATLLVKCADLADDQLKVRSVPPSSLSLLGLVRHMAKVEHVWFQRTMAGADTPRLYSTDNDPDGDFDNLATADAATDLAAFHTQVEAARQVAAQHDSLDAIAAAPRHGQSVSLRWIYVHMIEEYARHNGHADLLRECIDGAVGD
jgi:uncharacterized damage-inducible protein DinB